MRIDITEARKNLMELLNQAVQGDEIIIVQDGRPIVKMSPMTNDVSALSPQEKARLWREWAESHRPDTPLLSDEAVSRESIYEDRG